MADSRIDERNILAWSIITMFVGKTNNNVQATYSKYETNLESKIIPKSDLLLET